MTDELFGLHKMSLDTENNNYWTKKHGAVGKSCYKECNWHMTSLVPTQHEHALYFCCMEKCVKDKLEKSRSRQTARHGPDEN